MLTCERTACSLETILGDTTFASAWIPFVLGTFNQ
jgi:hypothetical protein